MKPLLPGYWLRSGSGLERALLVKFMQSTYQELYPDGSFAHLAETVEQYFSSQETPLWWVETSERPPEPQPAFAKRVPQPVAGLWMGNAIDQQRGDRHAHIFLLYVVPAYRRQGIGSALMNYAETWARQRGDRQIGLQVFQANQPALNLYIGRGYQTQSLWMIKPLMADE